MTNSSLLKPWPSRKNVSFPSNSMVDLSIVLCMFTRPGKSSFFLLNPIEKSPLLDDEKSPLFIISQGTNKMILHRCNIFLYRHRRCWFVSNRVYMCIYIHIPSGKRLHNYGKSPFSMGKSTISTGPFSIAMFVYQRVYIIIYHYNSATFDDGKSHGKSMKWTAKAQGCEIPCSINGHFRNRETLEVPSIYKAYFSGLCKGIYPQNMALYGTVPPI